MSMEKYLTLNEAKMVLGECLERQVRVLGIERFLLTNGKVKPDLSSILDLSPMDAKETKESVEISKKFLELFGNDKSERFCLVLDD
jgi:hypothetical protein